MTRIAVILTCFNRRDKTKHCIKTLIDQKNKYIDTIEFSIYLCNDGSTDGTKEMLEKYRQEGVDITILDGGNLYWDKGMHLAMQNAVKTKYDYYLMINDDVDFNDEFIKVMLDSYNDAGVSCGISGATQDSECKYTTYGGILFKSSKFMDPDGTLQECNLANWNCFLVDREIIDKVGIIDPNYDHSYGDFDYSMTMQRKGFKVYLAKNYIGICDRNTLRGTFKDKELTKKERIKRFFSPKGMSIKSGIRYSFKNFDYLGFKGLFKFLGAYCRNLIVVLIC